MCIIANMPLMHYHFPYVGTITIKLALIQAPHCKTTDMGYCITQCACLLPQLLLGTHSSLPTQVGLRLSSPGCLVLRRGGLPIKRQSPIQALTGPSVE